jgi:hypothetical protein
MGFPEHHYYPRNPSPVTTVRPSDLPIPPGEMMYCSALSPQVYQLLRSGGWPASALLRIQLPKISLRSFRGPRYGYVLRSPFPTIDPLRLTRLAVRRMARMSGEEWVNAREFAAVLLGLLKEEISDLEAEVAFFVMQEEL